MIDLTKVESSNSISGIPPCHYDSHLYNFDDIYKKKDPFFYKKLCDLTEDFLTLDVKKVPRYVFLAGFPGSGKTHYQVGLYRALAKKLGYLQGDGVIFTTYTGLAQEMIELFKENIPLRIGMQGYMDAKWFFIDDFTSSERVLKVDSLESTMLRDILIDRYEKGYTLVTSSNLSFVDLTTKLNAMFGDYIVSRLNDSKIIQFPEIDMRKQRK